MVSIAIILSLFVVVLGAYTRLTGAGLGCPDWPGCYGQMVLPIEKNKLKYVQDKYPNSPIETRQAWTEMAHRYAAGTLAILILVMGWSVFRKRLAGIHTPWRVPLLLLVLILLQAALGMWTVTLKLLPLVVMGHLLGGIFIFSGLCYFRLQLGEAARQHLVSWRFWMSLGVVLLVCQIALGGWVSSNYAGVACIGFPRCNGEWFPSLHLYQGFHLLSPVGVNYQGGVLDHDVRMTIQWIHRMGALIVFSYLLGLMGLFLLRVKEKNLQVLAILMIVLLLAQCAIGIINVIYLLPLWAAVLHNAVAALLLAAMVAMRSLATGGTHVQPS